MSDGNVEELLEELKDFGLAFDSAMVLLVELMDRHGVSLSDLEEDYPLEVEGIGKVWR